MVQRTLFEQTMAKDTDEVYRLRIQATALIQDVGIRLQFPQMTIATAMTLFHRFFSTQLLTSHDVMEIAQTSLFVSGKSEETPRRLRDVLNTVYRFCHPDLPPLQICDEFWAMKERLIESERQFLRVIGFDFAVTHPHSFALHFLRDLRANDDLANLTFAILNDSLRLPFCVHYEPHVIACSALYLATELLSVRTGDGDEEWWDRFGAHRTEVESICHAILDMYERAEDI
uniref:Cyclin-like domain-containing protein n=1 Tax=Spongospora subterranea TaxID=70186 RepID=A0A0H5QFX6_9EUKA|eukprot:CRZ00840.1 hypothetical protein [Spongospora subterranea]